MQVTQFALVLILLTAQVMTQTEQCCCSSKNPGWPFQEDNYQYYYERIVNYMAFSSFSPKNMVTYLSYIPQGMATPLLNTIRWLKAKEEEDDDYFQGQFWFDEPDEADMVYCQNFPETEPEPESEPPTRRLLSEESSEESPARLLTALNTKPWGYSGEDFPYLYFGNVLPQNPPLGGPTGYYSRYYQMLDQINAANTNNPNNITNKFISVKMPPTSGVRQFINELSRVMCKRGWAKWLRQAILSEPVKFRITLPTNTTEQEEVFQRHLPEMLRARFNGTINTYICNSIDDVCDSTC